MCDEHDNNSSGFIFGLIIGALIATAILLTSAEDKQKIIKKIKDKFKDLFDDKVEKPKTIIKKKRTTVPPLRDDTPIVSEVSKKISVTLPSDVETLNMTPVKELKPKKVFKKSK